MSDAKLDPRVVELVRQAMVGVVADPRGTGHRAAIPGVLVGGKTGTAQSPTRRPGSKKGKEEEDHGWFVGYAPADNPEIVVSALVEYGGHGGVVAAPLVRKVMEAYFNKKNALDHPAQSSEPTPSVSR